MESLVLITTIQPELIAWVAAISFFVSIAFTAIISPNRQWFELVVIFGLCFLVNLLMVGVIVQWIAGVELIQFEAIERVQQNFRQ